MRLAHGLAVPALMVGVTVFSAASVISGVRPSNAGSGIPAFSHVFLIMLENHSYGEVIGSPNAPHINALAQAYGLETNYYGVTHPSEPNYVASIGGAYFGIRDDGPYNTHTIDGPSLASQLEAAGLTWKTYQQALPYAGFTGTQYPISGPILYASKHDPFLNFAGIQNNPAELQHIVPDTQLATDLQDNQAPNFSYIVPDQCHDMHGTIGCTDAASLIQAADTYTNNTVNEIISSQVWQEGNNAIIVTVDEDDYSPTNLGCCDANPGGGHVATVVITSNGPRGVVDDQPANHYSLLLTIEDAFRLGCLRNACHSSNVRPLSALFRTSGAAGGGSAVYAEKTL